MVCVIKRKKLRSVFCTNYNHYKYTVMPFSLANTLATFKSYINATLRPYSNVFVIVYPDNPVVNTKIAEKHK